MNNDKLASEAIDRGVPSAPIKGISKSAKSYRNLTKASGFISLLQEKLAKGADPSPESLLKSFSLIRTLPQRQEALQWLKTAKLTDYYDYIKYRMNKKIITQDWSRRLVDATTAIPCGKGLSLRIEFYKGQTREEPLWLSMRVYQGKRATRNGLWVAAWSVIDVVPALERLMGRRKGSLTKLRNRFYGTEFACQAAGGNES